MTFWEKLVEFIRTEPAAFGGVITGLIQAFIGILVSFNVPLTPEQQQAVLGMTTALVSLTIVVSLVIRQNVTPTHRPRNDEGEDLVVATE
jgi:Kef-type K+ transport system membrane component KefB